MTEEIKNLLAQLPPGPWEWVPRHYSDGDWVLACNGWKRDEDGFVLEEHVVTTDGSHDEYSPDLPHDSPLGKLLVALSKESRVVCV